MHKNESSRSEIKSNRAKFFLKRTNEQFNIKSCYYFYYDYFIMTFYNEEKQQQKQQKSK